MFPRIVLFITSIFLLACQVEKNIGTTRPFTRDILSISQEAEIKLLGNNPDPTVTLDSLTSLSQALKERIGPADKPGAVIAKINDFLYNGWGVIPQADTSTVANTSLHTILQTKKASCLGLVSLYLAVTEGMDLPLFGVLLPGHLFLRYQDDTLSINIETLRNGIARTDSFYRDHFKVPAGDTYYLKNVKPDQVPGLLLYNLGNECRQRHRYEEAIGYFQRALEAFPGLAEAWINLGNIYLLLKQKARAEKAFKKAFLLRPELKDTGGKY